MNIMRTIAILCLLVLPCCLEAAEKHHKRNSKHYTNQSQIIHNELRRNKLREQALLNKEKKVAKKAQTPSEAEEEKGTNSVARKNAAKVQALSSKHNKFLS